MQATHDEIVETLDALCKRIDDLKKYKGAYEYICECIDKRLEDCEQETERLNEDLKAGVSGFGMSRKCFEVRVKKELLKDIIQIVEEALEEGSAE